MRIKVSKNLTSKILIAKFFFASNVHIDAYHADILLSFVILEMQQHQQQLVSLQQHKQQLEKHKKELEDLSMWSLFPKFLSKVGDTGGDPWMAAPSMPPFAPPIGTPVTSNSLPINLAQQKKQAASTRKQEKSSGAPASQPIQQHLLQVRVGCNQILNNSFGKTYLTTAQQNCKTRHRKCCLV